MNLKRLKALVTGGGTGLGLALTRGLEQKGVWVTICGRMPETLEAAVKELSSEAVSSRVCDVTQPDQVERLGEAVGDVDILINAAGTWLEGDLVGYLPKHIEAAIDNNLTGHILVTHRFLPAMLERGQGMIINIVSSAGLKPRAGQTVYAAAKFGMRGFTDSLREEVGSARIRVIGVYPGGMRTEFFAKAGFPKENESWMDPDEVAKAIIFAMEHDAGVSMDHLEINRLK
jgi:uncharacterized protein